MNAYIEHTNPLTIPNLKEPTPTTTPTTTTTVTPNPVEPTPAVAAPTPAVVEPENPWAYNYTPDLSNTSPINVARSGDE